ncbi:MAG: stage III sporulation protein AB [Clostridia bacterium]|nr:stage III sporulation protein AB [Clostridia bacterium]
MIKILILISIVGLTTALGVFLSANKKKRMQVFSELCEFNVRLIMNLKFSKNPLDKVAADFKHIPTALKGGKVLDGKDGEIISDYFLNLGKSDATSQIDYLNGKKEQLQRYRDESQTKYKKYSSLYIKIFFMVGVLMAILMA